MGWKAIWKNKSVDKVDTNDEFAMYCALKKADGFDVAVEDGENYYRAFYNGWLNFYEELVGYVREPKSVFEIGCGSGVNLYMFRNRLDCRVGGTTRHLWRQAQPRLPEARILHAVRLIW